MREDVFQRYSAYYDLLYRDKNYQAETDYVARTLLAANPNTKDVLEFGSGTGRHGTLLADCGFNVLGIERSESMVAASRQTSEPASYRGGGSFECHHGDIKTVKLDHAFDA